MTSTIKINEKHSVSLEIYRNSNGDPTMRLTCDDGLKQTVINHNGAWCVWAAAKNNTGNWEFGKTVQVMRPLKLAESIIDFANKWIAAGN